MKTKIKKIAIEMLKVSQFEMEKSIEKALNCGALDIDSWDEKNNPAILPKIIVMAVLQNEAEQYSAGGTCFEKEVNKNVKNLRCFI